MEKACERGNLQAALKRVRKNKGSPGSDGMTVDELPTHLRQHWPRCVGNWPETLPIGSAIEPVDPAAPVPEAPEPALPVAPAPPDA
jgi:hypothetical protein